MGGALRILTIRGIPIAIHASWLLIYALITWTLALGYFARELPDLPPLAHWANGLLAALLLFVSVLLHELSHSFVAVAHGLRVRGITLHVFGGVSQLDDDPPTPRAEFLIAVVGPLTSFAIGGLLWAVASLGVVVAPWARSVLGYLVFVNLAVGVFNLIPGFPLDGGRILRAALWRWQGALGRATYLAKGVGTGVAYALIAAGLLQTLYGNVVGGFWTVLIGLFLRNAADAGYAQVALREALDRLAVRDVMTREVVTVWPEATLAELGDLFWSHHVTSFPVVDERVRGIVALRQLQEVAPERRTIARVGEVMRPLADDLVVRPADPVVDAMNKASTNGLGRVAVLDGGRLVGYLSLKDITHVLALRGVGDGAAARAGVPEPGRRLRPAA